MKELGELLDLRIAFVPEVRELLDHHEELVEREDRSRRLHVQHELKPL